MDRVVERFLKYVQINTQSDPETETCPSTKNQLALGEEIVKELKEIGLADASMDQNGYVMATLPSNLDREVKTIGFIAHMDTSPDASGESVKPALAENYNGGDILLNREKNIILSPKDYPDMQDYIGETLIVTDGTALLGADDKAGIAEIMTAMEYLIENNIPHGDIIILFTPDEEIGRGADHFDVKKFNADFAYTVDGGPIGEINYENFNAASAKISIKGTNIHPGTAKDMMVNSILIGTELNNMLPVNERPEYTEGYEGFYHITRFKSTVEETKMEYIIRDHDMDKFNEKKELIKEIVKFLNKKYNNIISLEIEDSYYNMKEKIIPHFEIIAIAKQAMEELGIEAKIRPIRGGTDGAMLSYKGLLCPNIFTGGHNYHGKYEYIPVIAMEKAVQVIVKIIELNIEKNLKN